MIYLPRKLSFISVGQTKKIYVYDIIQERREIFSGVDLLKTRMCSLRNNIANIHNANHHLF